MRNKLHTFFGRKQGNENFENKNLFFAFLAEMDNFPKIEEIGKQGNEELTSHFFRKEIGK